MVEGRPLKSGWRRVKFGDVVQLSKVRSQDPLADGVERYVGLEHLEPGDLRIRSWGNVADGVTFTSVFQPGQVLFGKRRAYQRKVAVADFSGVCSGDIYVLETKDSSVLLPKLLPFICQTDAFYDHAVGTSAGSLSPRTNWSSLADFEFALPPKEEQGRLLQLFTVSHELAERYRDAIDAIEDARQAFLAYAFPEDPLSSVANSASVRRLDELAEIRTGLALGKKHGAKHLVPRPYLRVANVLDGELDLTDLKIVEARADELGRYELRDGDVLMTEGGDFDKLGRGTVWHGQINGCLHQNHVFAVRPNNSLLLSHYLAAMARSAYGKRYFLSCAKKTSNLASINKQQLSRFPVLWTPLKMQARIADQVAAYDLAERQLRQRLASANELAAKVLSSTFGTGP
jgi:type I restriction enzyme S subunit